MTALQEISSAFESAKKELFDAEREGVDRNSCFYKVLSESYRCFGRCLHIMQTHRGERIEQIGELSR